jgi:hypothetical protein
VRHAGITRQIPKGVAGWRGDAMRTVGKGMAIDPAYQHVTTPIVRIRVLYQSDYDATEWYEMLVKFAKYLAKDGKGPDGPAQHFGPGASDVQAFWPRLGGRPTTFN